MSQVNEKIVVIMPTLNESDNLRWLLPNLVEKYNVIVVDNNSTDNSGEIARMLGAQVVECPTQGYGSAVQAGVSSLKPDSKCEVVVILDADGSSPWEAIDRLVEPIFHNTQDLVIAQRDRREVGAMPFHAQFGNWLQVVLISLFTRYRYRDMGPLRALSLRTYRRLGLSDKTWGWNVEMQMKAVYEKLRIAEISITYRRRVYGKSKISGSVIGSIRAATRILASVIYYFVQGFLFKQVFPSNIPTI